MPVQWIVDLVPGPQPRPETHFDDLHRAACRFFEQPDTDHAAEDKPFAVRLPPASPSSEDDTCARLVYTWLADLPPPRRSPPTTFRLGKADIAVTASRAVTIPYQRLESATVTRRATFTVSTPAKFRHNGRDYPLPDPHITFSSLGRHYQRYRTDMTTPEEIRQLADTVVVYTHDIHTERFTWHNRDTAGFVGRVEFGVPRTASEHLQRLFTTLCRFAALAGLGHGTTHGLGATDLGSRADKPAVPAGSCVTDDTEGARAEASAQHQAQHEQNLSQ